MFEHKWFEDTGTYKAYFSYKCDVVALRNLANALVHI